MKIKIATLLFLFTSSLVAQNAPLQKIYKQGVMDSVKVIEHVIINQKKDVFIKEGHSLLIPISDNSKDQIVKKSIIATNSGYDWAYIEVDKKNWIYLKSSGFSLKEAMQVRDDFKAYGIKINISDALSGTQKKIESQIISGLLNLVNLTSDYETNVITPIIVSNPLSPRTYRIGDNAKFQVVNRVITESFYNLKNYKSYTDIKPLNNAKYRKLRAKRELSSKGNTLKKVNFTKKAKLQTKRGDIVFENFTDIYSSLVSSALLSKNEIYYDCNIFVVGDILRTKRSGSYAISFIDSDKGVVVIESLHDKKSQYINITKK